MKCRRKLLQVTFKIVMQLFQIYCVIKVQGEWNLSTLLQIHSRVRSRNAFFKLYLLLLSNFNQCFVANLVCVGCLYLFLSFCHFWIFTFLLPLSECASVIWKSRTRISSCCVLFSETYIMFVSLFIFNENDWWQLFCSCSYIW